MCAITSFRLRLLLLGTLLATLAGAALADVATPHAPADFTVTNTMQVPRDQFVPLGANNWGGCGAIEYAANNIFSNSGNEPIYWRNLHRVANCDANWFEIDGPGTDWWQLWNSGFLSGASVRIYRIVDKAGQPLPLTADGSYIDLAHADHVILVGATKVIPDGSAGYPDGGWIANNYSPVYPYGKIQYGNLSCTDVSGVENGRTYWFTVTAISADGHESDIAPGVSEASAMPQAGLNHDPHIIIANNDPMPTDVKPSVTGGQAPFQWRVLDEAGNPLTLPAGMTLDAVSGQLTGAAPMVRNLRFSLQVTDAAGHVDRRSYVFNPVAPTDKGKPQPPTGVTAVAGDGCVTVSWTASPSANVVAYALKRSSAPLAKQQSRVYLAADAPALHRWDYVVLQRKFDPFNMRYISPRVRGIGNPMNSPNWHWRTDLQNLSLKLVPHPKPIPAEMIEPGETCLQIDAKAGEHYFDQITFIGLGIAGESDWYGQLEPGKHYRLEVWLRQSGLANNGLVNFNFGVGYPELKTSFSVTDAWKKYTYDLVGPERPAGVVWHFGPRFIITGPGTLWLDNARLFRYDTPEELQQYYTPNPTVLNELLAAQPTHGPKGAHRTWFLQKDMTMASILSWHANSCISPDWNTGVSGTAAMTLPMALQFDYQTGASPETRMRPWLVLQHILHSEADWQALIEFLAAPYDPNVDTPQAKPWAYQRYQQRGIGRPWTAEFTQITIEFGNETWHNGWMSDWLGFSKRNAVHQGGAEYGLFCQYLIEQIKQSPYWSKEHLAQKIRFNLGANYFGTLQKDGTVTGYGEEAIQHCRDAVTLEHANYVGPKWETGDKSQSTFNDHGVQETMLGWLTDIGKAQGEWAKARAALTKAGHPYGLVAYEGGPSGYALPGSGTPTQDATNEHYGKSLAMAISCMDEWMGSYLLGWSDQCFLGYGEGSHWNSHTLMGKGFRGSPAWLALSMRNRYVSGDLMSVIANTTPTLQRDKETYPLVGVYAAHDGKVWSVIVVSRKLDGNHDGVDFADGYTPVTLHLPITAASRIVLRTLSGDPRQTNIDAQNISIKEQNIPVSALTNGAFIINAKTGGSAHGMPPGSIYIYNFVDGGEVILGH